MSTPAPVLWICGASGAGKSAAAWALFDQLVAAGACVAYVDIDQLGMLYPAVSDDPAWHHTLKAEALATLLDGYAAAGAHLVVVSGVVDPREGPARHLPQGTDLTLCLLSPDPAVLRERILQRGWAEAAADEAVAENALLQQASFVHTRIDTASLTVADTVSELRDLARLDGGARRPSPRQGASSALTPVVVLTGARAVGSSTVGFAFAQRRWRAGRRTGFVDLQQLGFLGRDGRIGHESALAIGQFAALHSFMTGRGAELLVMTAHLTLPDRKHLRAAVPHAKVTVVRHRADERTLREHVRSRVDGSDARLAGDDLSGADQATQDAVVAAALVEQDLLDTGAVDDAVLDVSGRMVTEVVVDVERIADR